MSDLVRLSSLPPSFLDSQERFDNFLSRTSGDLLVSEALGLGVEDENAQPFEVVIGNDLEGDLQDNLGDNLGNDLGQDLNIDLAANVDDTAATDSTLDDLSSALSPPEDAEPKVTTPLLTFSYSFSQLATSQIPVDDQIRIDGPIQERKLSFQEDDDDDGDGITKPLGRRHRRGGSSGSVRDLNVLLASFFDHERAY